MASSKLIFFLCTSTLLFHATLAHELVCEEIPTNQCAFAIAASGKRCLLEAKKGKDGIKEYRCVTSEVTVDLHKLGMFSDGEVESDECIASCGLKRMTVGMSSDALLDPKFTHKLCSTACYDKCRNINDLYTNLATGEGAYLPKICEALRSIPQRNMIELLSSGGVLGTSTASAPAPAPK